MKKHIKKKEKKGVSVMIGYVLLITAAVVLGVIVYQWLRTYVPSEGASCPEGVSIFIKDYSCNSGGNQLNLTIKNNGKFSLAGYFIHASNQSDREIATTDISQKVSEGGAWAGGSVAFVVGSSENPMKPNQEVKNVFNLSNSEINQIYLIEIIPARFQEVNDQLTFVSCGNAKIKEELSSCLV